MLTINVPVVYMARDVMILMRPNLFRGPLEGVCPKNLDFLGHGNGNKRSEECHLSPKKWEGERGSLNSHLYRTI